MHAREHASDGDELTVPPVLYDENTRVRDRIITPYSSSAFHTFLSRFNLLIHYPLLVSKIRNGFPLGDFTPIIESFTPPNHPSILVYHDVVSKYLLSEREKGRMSGPYTAAQLESELGGPFRSSPVQVVLKQAKPRMAINLSFRGRAGTSVNDMIDSDDFPTRWGGAAEVEEVVSQPVSFFQPALGSNFLSLHGYNVLSFFLSKIVPRFSLSFFPTAIQLIHSFTLIFFLRFSENFVLILSSVSIFIRSNSKFFLSRSQMHHLEPRQLLWM